MAVRAVFTPGLWQAQAVEIDVPWNNPSDGTTGVKVHHCETWEQVRHALGY